MKNYSMGKLTSLLTLLHNSSGEQEIKDELTKRGYRYTVGKVGAMDLFKVIAAIETTAKSNNIIDGDAYREVHALYHTILEALQGVGRGNVQFGEILRTVGLTFGIVRGEIEKYGYNGEWICVCIFGTIGAPKKGFEHDALGLGFNHI